MGTNCGGRRRDGDGPGEKVAIEEVVMNKEAKRKEGELGCWDVVYAALYTSDHSISPALFKTKHRQPSPH